MAERADAETRLLSIIHKPILAPGDFVAEAQRKASGSFVLPGCAATEPLFPSAWSPIAFVCMSVYVSVCVHDYCPSAALCGTYRETAYGPDSELTEGREVGKKV